MTYTIHRYPAHLIDVVILANGKRLTLRPVLPQDSALLQTYVRGLSQEARYMRFMRGLRELPPGLLDELTSVDYTTHMALLAMTCSGGNETIVAEAHYAADEVDPEACEFAVSVTDEWQGFGIGRTLLDRLARDAAAIGFRKVIGNMLRENRRMQALARKIGLQTQSASGDPLVVRMVKELAARPEETGSLLEALTVA